MPMTKEKEKYHAGRSKWGKYKKKEKEAKKNKKIKKLEGKKSKSSSVERDSQAKESFDFPDGGWVCSECQNYNFHGRVRCNRCHKQKSTEDQEGKPKHLIRHQQKDDSKRSGNSPGKSQKVSSI